MKTEEERPVEFAATLAALQPESPLLARPLYLYRIQYGLTVEQMASWLGLTEAEDFYRLAVCLSPRLAVATMGWKQYTNVLGKCFPSLKLPRLQLAVETVTPNSRQALATQAS